MAAVIISKWQHWIIREAARKAVAMTSHFKISSSFFEPDIEQSPIDPAGTLFIRCGTILNLLKIDIGGTYKPVAPMQ